MSTLAEIEEAADALSEREKKALLRFLAMRLRREASTAQPRMHAAEELATVLAEDDADGKQLREDAHDLPCACQPCILALP